MQIEHIHITGFGRLVNWTPDPPPDPGVTLFCGPNEAGKSTLRQFLVTMLFGFDGKVQGRHPYNPWQGADLGGEITYTVDGDRFLLRRHLRGRTNSVELIHLPDQTAMPPARSERLLATHIPVSRDLYRCLFAVDLAELRPLDARTAHAVQEQFATDFQTLGEIASPNQALNDLAAAIEAIARRGRRGPHKALLLRLEKQRRELRKREREARNSIDEYRTQEEECRRIEAELDELRRKRIRIQNEIQRLQNLGPVRRIRERLRALKQQRATLEDWKDFPRDRREEFDRLRRDIEAREDACQERSRELADAGKAEADAGEALKRFPDLARIEQLRTVADRARSIPDIHDALEELNRRTTDLDRRRTDLAHGLFPADAEAVPAAFQQAFAGAARQVCAEFEKQLTAIEKIESELRPVQTRRDVTVERLRELETEEAQLKSQVPDDYPADFNDGMLRDAEALEQLCTNRDQVRRRIEAIADNRKALDRQLQELEAASTPGGAFPRRSAILLGLAAAAGVAGIALAVLHPGGSAGLVAGVLSLVGAGVTLTLGLSGLRRRGPGPHKVLREERRNQLEQARADSAQAEEDARRELEHLEERMALLAKRAGFDEIPTDTALETAIPRLRTWAQAATAVHRLALVRKSAAEVRRKDKEYHAALDDLEAQAGVLWDQYRAGLAGVGLGPPGRKTDVLHERARLQRAVELAGLLAETTRLTQEAVVKKQALDKRTAAMETALREWKVDASTDTPLSAVRALDKFIENALEAHRRHQASSHALEQARQRAKSANTVLEQARHALAEFLRAVDCETPEQFEERARAAVEYARLSAEITDLEQNLSGVADSAAKAPEPCQGLESTAGDTAGEDPADWPEERIRERLDELRFEEERTATDVRKLETLHTEVRTGLRELEEKVRIEEIRGLREDLDARIRHAEQRRDVLVLTEHFLRDAIEQFAHTHRVPVLERAGELLELVTAGRYRELRPADRTSNALDKLEVIPNGGGQPVPMDRLSRGTVEQVFLALRLALAAEMSGGRPLPVILDDVLVNADDHRLPGCIETIMRLGESMQIFAFTCHERVAAEFERLGAPRRELPA